MAQKINTSRNLYVVGTTAPQLTPEHNNTQAKKPQAPQRRTRARRIPVYKAGPLFAYIALICVGIALSITVLSTGIQHYWLSSDVSYIEQREYNSYGASRWDAEAKEEYYAAQEAVRDFGETSFFAYCSVSLGANIFTKLLRFAIYCFACACLAGGVYLISVSVFPIIRNVFYGKAKIKF